MAAAYFFREVTRSTCLGAGDDLDMSRTAPSDSTWVSANVTGTFETVVTWDIDVRADGGTPTDGLMTVKINCSLLSSGATWRYRWHIIDDETGCTVQESQGWQTETTSGNKSAGASPPVGGWTGHDVLRVEVQLERDAGEHGNKKIEIDVGDGKSRVDTPWTVATTIERTFDADLIVVDRPTITFDMDMIVFGTSPEITFDADLILTDRVERTFDADLIVFQPTITFDADVILTDRIERTFDADVILTDRLTITFDADVILTDRIERTFDADLIVFQPTITFDADLIVIDVIERTFDIDLILVDVGEITFDADLIVFQPTVTFDASVILVDQPTITFDADIIVTDRIEVTFDADMIVFGSPTITFDADLVVVDRLTFTFDADVILIDVTEITFDADLIVFQPTITFDASVILVDRSTITFDADLILVDRLPLTFDADLIVFQPTITFDADMIVFSQPTVTFDADLILIDVLTVIFDADLSLVDRTTVTFDSDVIVTDRVLRTFDADLQLEFEYTTSPRFDFGPQQFDLTSAPTHSEAVRELESEISINEFTELTVANGPIGKFSKFDAFKMDAIQGPQLGMIVRLEVYMHVFGSFLSGAQTEVWCRINKGLFGVHHDLQIYLGTNRTVQTDFELKDLSDPNSQYDWTDIDPADDQFIEVYGTVFTPGAPTIRVRVFTAWMTVIRFQDTEPTQYPLPTYNLIGVYARAFDADMIVTDRIERTFDVDMIVFTPTTEIPALFFLSNKGIVDPVVTRSGVMRTNVVANVAVAIMDPVVTRSGVMRANVLSNVAIMDKLVTRKGKAVQ